MTTSLLCIWTSWVPVRGRKEPSAAALISNKTLGEKETERWDLHREHTLQVHCVVGRPVTQSRDNCTQDRWGLGSSPDFTVLLTGHLLLGDSKSSLHNNTGGGGLCVLGALTHGILWSTESDVKTHEVALSYTPCCRQMKAVVRRQVSSCIRWPAMWESLSI
jgi:hypothetical protein